MRGHHSTTVRGTPTFLAVFIALLLAAPLFAQQATGSIAGTVTEKGKDIPVAGAQVAAPATRQGAVADANGKYVIRGLAAGRVVLRVQFIGYEPVELAVQVPSNGTVTADFAIVRTAVQLSGVVITATGEEKRRSIGNAITSLETAEMPATAAANMQDMLAGSTAGVSVLANSGQPGAGGTIRLRGVNSISQGNNPLIYVDGVRIYGGRTPTNVGGRQFIDPFNDINAEDIDHVEIVKGPAATTLYGTEASGGVIQIFTKQGKDGAARWQSVMTTGFNNMGHVGPKSDPTGMFLNQCRGPNLVMGDGKKFEDPTCPASGSWLRNGPINKLNLSVSGRGTGVTYFVAINSDDAQGVLPTGSARTTGLRMNLGFQPAKGVDVALNSSVTQNKIRGFADGNSANGVMLNITRGSGSNFKGPGCVDLTVTCVLNDSLFLARTDNTTNHFITGATLTYAPSERFSNRLAIGFDYNNAQMDYTVPFGYLRLPLGAIWNTLWTRQFLSADFASTYRRPLGEKWATTTSVGGQVFDSRVYQADLESDNFSGPGTPTLLSGSVRLINDLNQQRVINAGFFGQQTLAWRDILFLTAGARVDGNSAFGRSFGLQTYPKFSVSYVISDELFWKRNWIEMLKLRAAIGESGKAPGAFDAVRTWDPVAAENGQPAFAPNQVGNANLGPERTRELEMGFDLSALDGRLGVVASYFNSSTMEALIPVTQSPSNGFTSSQLMNVGKLLNSGVEATVTGEFIRTSRVNLTAAVGLTKFWNQAGYVGGQQLTIYALGRTFVLQGLPVPSYMGPKVMNPNELANPVIQQNQYLGAAFADRIITPSVTLKLWNRVTINAAGEWQRGGNNLNATAYQNANLLAWQPCYATQARMRTAAAGDSSALKDVTAMERARCTINTKIARDYAFFVEANDFFKLRSMSVTYDLPTQWLRAGAKSASLILAGRNLLTITKYTGTDPETSDQSDATFARRDYYVFPTSRSFTATLRLGF